MGLINLQTDQEDLYVDVRTRSHMPFQFYIGPRGTGKSFTCLRQEINNPMTGDKFLYLRNTKAEVQVATSPVGNAFKRINTVYGTDVIGDFSNQLGFGTFEMNDKNDIIGYAFGITTFAGARSIDLTDVSHMVFEEFIPEEHVPKRRARGKAFLNLYETVNRNRELEGKDAVTVYFLANAISLADEILLEMGIVNDIQNMLRNGENRRTIPQRGVYIEIIDAKVVDKKKDTALYRLGNTSFNNQALRADFANARLNLIQRKFNQRDYVPYISYAGITIYKSKQERHMHIAATGETAKNNLLETETLRLRSIFRSEYITELGADRISFDSFETRNLLEAALKLNDN